MAACYLQNKKKLTDIENNRTHTKGESGGKDKLGLWH